MNTAGLAILVRMGNCLCVKERIKVNGRQYYIRERLGEGGFSMVDLVEDASSHKLYALKRITCHAQTDQKVALAEVEYLKALSHPNIVECIDSDLVGMPDLMGNRTSQVLIVLPYCQRGTLHDELMRRQQSGSHLDEVVVLSMFRRICEAVQCMHSAKPHPLAHRDIKTSNILLKDDLTPLLMDLGSVTRARLEINGSSEAHKLQDEAAERSSMPYRPPELFNVEFFCHVDERTDVWSLGCLLYALCFYKSPFDAVYERGDSVALAVVSGITKFPETHPYSEDIVELIKSILKVNPEERPYVDWIINKVDQLINKSSGAV
ncbi:serine/threonine-protein kinase 16-like [Homarus americanus]|uniref:non-specific serine/threonine protein kinase n=1 Tax=Homarus americanus TaxID=6706 RepID=A0A8J5MU36_HOMAM|nr:serine/threonine-protein kinase 16-like [Homarus americanus]XP_042230582.1 serine/threonine-protein kinase 16-like [Homarus americanus]KAG7164123.1 Serine/threonine-protein kinase 16-like [Homarus americanus]